MVAPLWFCIYLLKRSPLNTLLIRVFSGGLSPVTIAAYMLTASTVSNCLVSECFCGQATSCLIISGLAAILPVWCCLSYGRQLEIGTAIGRSHPVGGLSRFQLSRLVFTVFIGTVPFGLHHIWNVPFQMQIGEYTNAAGQVFHGDIPRAMAGDPAAGMLSGGFLFKMCTVSCRLRPLLSESIC